MAIIADELKRLQKLVNEGRGGEHCLPLIRPAHEAAARVANKEGKTKFIAETDSHHIYSRLNAAKDRAIRVIENKSVTWEVLALLWERVSDEELRHLAEGH
jgi:predicted transcriptional regulator